MFRNAVVILPVLSLVALAGCTTPDSHGLASQSGDEALADPTDYKQFAQS